MCIKYKEKFASILPSVSFDLFYFLLLKNLFLSFFYSFYHYLSSLDKNSMNSISCFTQISYEMVSDVDVHQLAD